MKIEVLRKDRNEWFASQKGRPEISDSGGTKAKAILNLILRFEDVFHVKVEDITPKTDENDE